MKWLSRSVVAMLLAANALLLVAMWACAYTACLPPQEFPKVSYWGLMFPLFLLANVAMVVVWLVVKWKLAVLPLVGLLLCGGSVRAYFPMNWSEEPPKGCLKVLSYNVMGFGETKGKKGEENEVLDYLLGSGADVVCLQEGKKRVVDEAQERITDVYPYQDTRLVSDNYMACFSKYPIDSVEEIEYPSKTNHSFVYAIRVGKDTLWVVNNHLESYRLSKADKADYKSIIENYQHPDQNDSEQKYLGLTGKLARHDSIRGIQVDSVAAYVEKVGHRHVVVCGDFNATPISYVHYRLTKILNDAYTRSGNGPGISYNRSGMYFRIDHILVSEHVEAYGAKVDRSIKKSDHYPIFCFIKLK